MGTDSCPNSANKSADIISWGEYYIEESIDICGRLNVAYCCGADRPATFHLGEVDFPEG